MRNLFLCNLNYHCIFSLDKEPIAEPSARQGTKNLNDNSTLDDGTSLDNQQNHNSVFRENTSTFTAKGKRLKIVDIESEKDSETNENLTGASCADKTNELQVSATQQIGFNDRTNESQNHHSVEEEEKRIELPGLVIGAQDEGTRLFKLGRYAEAAEQFTKAIDILEKGNPCVALTGPSKHHPLSHTLVFPLPLPSPPTLVLVTHSLPQEEI